MIRKPNLKMLITLFNNLEKSLAKENWDKTIKNLEVFTSIVKVYKKQINSLNSERK